MAVCAASQLISLVTMQVLNTGNVRDRLTCSVGSVNCCLLLFCRDVSLSSCFECGICQIAACSGLKTSISSLCCRIRYITNRVVNNVSRCTYRRNITTIFNDDVTTIPLVRSVKVRSRTGNPVCSTCTITGKSPVTDRHLCVIEVSTICFQVHARTVNSRTTCVLKEGHLSCCFTKLNTEEIEVTFTGSNRDTVSGRRNIDTCIRSVEDNVVVVNSTGTTLYVTCNNGRVMNV